ncbi:MAG TPA: O-antigen ligase family protein [Planctomycetota bacterium]
MSRWVAVLERAALALATAGAVLRWGVSGGFAGPGLNLFIHLLPILALAVWFASRGLAGGATWRFSGVEIAVLALAIVHFVSVLRAAHRLPALEAAVGHLAFGLFLVLALQAMGRDGLRRLLLAAGFAACVLALLQYAIIFPATADRVAESSVELRNRHATYEPFATFAGPNQLAAFLVLVVPLALGASIDARPRGLAALAPPALIVGLGAFALVLTGSLGGWVSIACAAAAFAALALTRRRGRPAMVVAGAAAVAVAVGLLLYTPLLETLAAKSHSLHVRRAYWTAAGRVIAERPVGGVGLGNFEDHYARVKGDVQQETRHVHNDYLQVLAETGVVGLLAFAAFLGLGLRRACAAEAEPPEDVEPPRRWILPAAGAAAFLLLALRFWDFSLLAGAFAWAGWAWAAARTAPPAGPWTRIGAAAGFLGLLTHLTVDFLWIDLGVALALYAGLGLLLAYGKSADVRLSPKVCAAAASALALVAGPMFILTGPALAADRELQEARDADDPAAAAAFSEAALRHNPLLADAHVIFGAAQFGLAGDDPLRAEAALRAVDDAILLRPDHVSYRIIAAQLNFALYLRFRKQAGEVARTRAEAYLGRAREHQDRGITLYPAHARGRYDLGRMLDLLGERDRAAAEFAEALRFSDLAAKEVENRRDLQLQGIRRMRALARTGRAEEAAGEAKRLLPLGSEGDVRRILEEVRRRPELLRGVSEDELDEVTRPLIEAAIDGLLKSR